MDLFTCFQCVTISLNQGETPIAFLLTGSKLIKEGRKTPFGLNPCKTRG